MITPNRGFEARRWRLVAAGLLLFGITFGYVEAAVVVYLRTLIEPIRRQVDPRRASGDLFPIVTVDQLESKAPQLSQLRFIEVAREASTLMMLAAVAWVATAGREGWLAAFAITFGAWDLFFYIFLKVLIGWPASLLTWDILFLVPVPWVAPVLAPVIVSLSIIGSGLLALRRPIRISRPHWALVTCGCLLILASFMWDFRNIVAGGQPHPFLWTLFAAGEVAGLGGFIHAVRRSRIETAMAA